jgi:hypothetical protein
MTETRGPLALSAETLGAVAAIIGLFSIRRALAMEKWIRGNLPAPPPNVVVTDPPSEEERLWQNKAEEARLSELETVRTAAAGWGSTIAAVTGAIGVVALVKGPDQINDLTHGWKILAAVLVGLAVLTVLRGILLAAIAAQGSPRSFGYAPREFRSRYRAETLLAARALQVSRALVVLATLFGAAAIGVVWFGDTADKAGPTRAFAVTADGTPLCGTLNVSKPGIVTVTPDGAKKAIPISPKALRALVPTGECP